MKMGEGKTMAVLGLTEWRVMFWFGSVLRVQWLARAPVFRTRAGALRSQSGMGDHRPTRGLDAQGGKSQLEGFRSDREWLVTEIARTFVTRSKEILKFVRTRHNRFF